MIRVLVVLCSTLALIQSEGYWDIQLSPQSISSVPFGDGHISIWEHASVRGRYYAMPLVYLLQESATVIDNILTDDLELEFEVLMWSLEAREAVYRHLKTNVNSTIVEDQIEMLPMEKIRIVWRDRIRGISQHFTLVDHWKSNTHLPASVFFQFTCTERAKCERLKEAMKNNPRIFNALEIEYIINGQKSARRDLTVTGNHLLRGQLFSSIAAMSNKAERYVTFNDLKTITSESVSNVIGSIVTDANYVDTGDEVGVKDILMAELSRQEVSTNEFQPHMWDSVFWDPLWARPDKLTHYLNNVLEKDTSDERFFLLDENERSRSAEGSAGGKFFGIEASGSAGSSSASKSKLQKEDVLNTLRERHHDVEWTGEVFRVKPMKLFRLNLSTLNTSRHVATANVQVRQYETVQSIKLRLTNSGASQTPSLSPQLLEARLTARLDQLSAQANQTIRTKMAEVTQLVTMATNKVTSAEGRLDSAIRNNHAAVTGRLGGIDARLRGLPGWPSGGYCLLARGGCPAGFSRATASLPHVSMSSRGSLGDSTMVTTRGGHNRDRSTTFTLVACCR